MKCFTVEKRVSFTTEKYKGESLSQIMLIMQALQVSPQTQLLYLGEKFQLSADVFRSSLETWPSHTVDDDMDVQSC